MSNPNTPNLFAENDDSDDSEDTPLRPATPPLSDKSINFLLNREHSAQAEEQTRRSRFTELILGESNSPEDEDEESDSEVPKAKKKRFRRSFKKLFSKIANKESVDTSTTAGFSAEA